MKVIFIFSLFFATNSYAKDDVKTSCFKVEGMTCVTCTITLKSAVNKLDGISEVRASVKKKNAIVKYVPTKTSPSKIKSKIDSVGYKAIEKKCENTEG